MNKSSNKKYLTIKYPLLILLVITIIQYLPTLFYGLTNLDDSTFIIQYQPYNEHFSNLITSFTRGVFNGSQSLYYRPIFLDSILLNYKICGQNLMGFHIGNLLLHLLSIVLLYCLFKKLNIRSFHSFLLCLIFAVHPVLVQAVAWIPGRNDSLLAISVFLYFIFSINYAKSGSIKSIIISNFCLLMACFTKESAVTAIPVLCILLFVVLNEKWNSKRSLVQYVVWGICIIVWFLVKLHFMPNSPVFSYKQTLSALVYRIPVLVQYFGKIFLPINLSVYPTQNDTTSIFGLIIIILFIVLLVFKKNMRLKLITSSIFIFLLLLLPSLLVPNAAINQQAFEHRLYVPFFGSLLLVYFAAIFESKLSDKSILIVFLIISSVLSVINFTHQKNFASPIAFWTQAVKTSPNSPNANMMLAVNTMDRKIANQLFQKVFDINPKQKFLNLRYGIFMMNVDSFSIAEKYLIDEIEFHKSYESYYYLMKIAYAKQNYGLAITCMQQFLRKDPFFDISTENHYLLNPELSTAKGCCRFYDNIKQSKSIISFIFL